MVVAPMKVVEHEDADGAGKIALMFSARNLLHEF